MLEKYLATPNERQCYHLYCLHSIEAFVASIFQWINMYTCVCSGVAHSLGFLRAMVQKLHLSYLRKRQSLIFIYARQSFIMV